MRNVSDRSCRENQNTHIVFSNFFSRKSCRLLDNGEKCGTARQATDDNIIRFMPIACWKTKVRDTDSEYVILIAFSWQQWLRELATMLRNTYTASLVILYLVLATLWIESGTVYPAQLAKYLGDLFSNLTVIVMNNE
jgi:hypothetical protein